MAARVSGRGGTGPSSSYSVGTTARAFCAAATDSAAPSGCAASGSGCELSARFASATASSAAAQARRVPHGCIKDFHGDNACVQNTCSGFCD